MTRRGQGRDTETKHHYSMEQENHQRIQHCSHYHVHSTYTFSITKSFVGKYSCGQQINCINTARLTSHRWLQDKADENSSSSEPVPCLRPPLPSFACLHLSSLRDGIISDIRSSVGRDSISTATRLRDGDRSSYWHTNNHAAPELGRSVELLNFDITHYSEGDACLLYLGTK